MLQRVRRAPLTRRIPARSVLGNLGARVVAVLALAGATVLVARLGGAEDVGILALLRVLPGLFGVLAACRGPPATSSPGPTPGPSGSGPRSGRSW